MTADISQENVARMLEGVTPGPWLIDTATKGYEVCTMHGLPTQPTEDGMGQSWVYIRPERVTRNGEWYWPNEQEQEQNARFIAYAREAVPALSARLAKVTAEREGLLSEGAALSSWQCPFTDGKTGLSSDDHGNQFCQMQRRAEAAEAREAKLRDALQYGHDIINGESIGSEWKKGSREFLKRARAALQETKP